MHEEKMDNPEISGRKESLVYRKGRTGQSKAEMDKKVFMDQLREGLDGNVSYEKYRETIEYYEAYFQRKLAEGKTEEEIVAELGSGRLIAKTIVDTAGAESIYGSAQRRTGWQCII